MSRSYRHLVENFDCYSMVASVYRNSGPPGLRPSQSSRTTGKLRAIEIRPELADGAGGVSLLKGAA